MVGKKVSSVFHTSQKVILLCECLLTIEHIVRHRVAASGEPMIPEVAQLLRMTPESDFIPQLSVRHGKISMNEICVPGSSWITGKIVPVGQAVDGSLMV